MTKILKISKTCYIPLSDKEYKEMKTIDIRDDQTGKLEFKAKILPYLNCENIIVLADEKLFKDEERYDK